MRAAEQGGSTIRRVSTAGNRQIRLELLASIEEKLKKPPFDGFRWDLGSVPATSPDHLFAVQHGTITAVISRPA